MVHGVVFNQTIVRKADIKKQSAVVKSFQRDAFGDDDYHPISMTGSNLSESGGIGYFIVDVMDTMKLMGLEGEYGRARTWVETKLDFNRDGRFNTFETTIRVLGGLLSLYQLTDDQLYLDKAVDLADRMLPVFDTPVGLPTTMVNLKTRKGISDPDNPGLVSTAEAGTLQLEFKYLSHLTDNEIYWEKAEQIMKVLKKGNSPWVSTHIFTVCETTGEFVNAPIRLGSRGDSYYEYLLKQHLQTAQTESVYREMWNLAVQGIHDHLVKFSEATGKTYTQEIVPEYQRDGMKFTQSPKQDHLVCFLGGTLMLGATTVGALVTPVSVPPKPSELTPQGLRDWKTGYELIETCMDTHRMKSGLPPEIVHFRVPDDGFGPIKDDWYIKGHRPLDPPPYDARYMLRPETVESLFMAFRLTGDERYRRYGWKIFQSIDRWCKVETGGYSTILDVDNPRGEKEDKMETFFLSETLKYLYLLFSDVEVLPLDKYVFNTEAHPLPVFEPTIRTSFV
ncbi:glycoside hydrolase [Flagelloscypha sp. PMI_526]|nr:glycoside hydrolase [Flagelloscypha sp. PMI_526]